LAIINALYISTEKFITILQRCRICSENFRFNNKFYQHIRFCYSRKNDEYVPLTEENFAIANVIADMLTADMLIADMLIMRSIPTSYTGVDFRGYRYSTVKIKFHPNSEAENVCPDTGSARILADRG
jgi:hypothetical protein